MPVRISKEKKISGSIVYKEGNTGSLVLEFYQSDHKLDDPTLKISSRLEDKKTLINTREV